MFHPHPPRSRCDISARRSEDGRSVSFLRPLLPAAVRLLRHRLAGGREPPHACTSKCTHARVRARAMYARALMHAHAHARARTRTYAHMHASSRNICTYTHARTRTRLHAHKARAKGIHACTHKHARAARAHADAHMQSRAHSHAHGRTCARACTHGQLSRGRRAGGRGWIGGGEGGCGEDVVLVVSWLRLGHAAWSRRRAAAGCGGVGWGIFLLILNLTPNP